MSQWLSRLAGTLLDTFGIGPKGVRATIDASGLTSNRTYTLPDQAGTFSLNNVYRNTITGDGATEVHPVNHGLSLSDENDFIAALYDTNGKSWAVEFEGVDGDNINVNMLGYAIPNTEVWKIRIIGMI